MKFTSMGQMLWSALLRVCLVGKLFILAFQYEEDHFFLRNQQ